MTSADEPDWSTTDFARWGDPRSWPKEWHLKARAAILRNAFQLDVRLVPHPDTGTWDVVVFSRTVFTGDVDRCRDLLVGILIGCQLSQLQRVTARHPMIPLGFEDSETL